MLDKFPKVIMQLYVALLYFVNNSKKSHSYFYPENAPYIYKVFRDPAGGTDLQNTSDRVLPWVSDRSRMTIGLTSAQEVETAVANIDINF